MAEPVRDTQSKLDFRSWVRAFRLRDILVVWGILILAGLVLGALGEWLERPLLRDIAANLVPDLFVAGLALIAAEAIFGFRERQEQRAEERKRIVEAREKAVRIVRKEIGDNWNELLRIVVVLRERRLNQWDAVFHRESVIQTESWKLLIQSPLIVDIPLDLVWALHESYYESQRLIDNLRYSLVGQFAVSDKWWSDLCGEFLPKFEEAWTLTSKAIGMLDEYGEM